MVPGLGKLALGGEMGTPSPYSAAWQQGGEALPLVLRRSLPFPRQPAGPMLLVLLG